MGVYAKKIMMALEAKGSLAKASAQVKQEMEKGYDDRIGDVYRRLIREALERTGKDAEYKRLKAAGDTANLDKLIDQVGKSGELYEIAYKEVRASIGLPPEAKRKKFFGLFG
jgi:stalled ribosome rescue protein Dom34